MKLLKDVFKNIEIVESCGSLDQEIMGITCSSGKVEKGWCFVAIKGFKKDGIEYLNEALKSGAVAVITENPPDRRYTEKLVWIQVKDARRVQARAASLFWDNPSEGMEVIGITGTNGKTSIAELLGKIHESYQGCGIVGTLGMKTPEGLIGTSLTTPESSDIQRFMGMAKEAGKKSIVMEVSSVALELRRVSEISFNQGIFTSFSGDHLDFHGDMESYLNAKLKLFKSLGADGWGIISSDISQLDSIIEELECRYLTYGFSEDSDVRPFNLKLSIKGSEFSVMTPAGGLNIKTSLIGRINVMNILGVVASAVASGIPFKIIGEVLKDARPIKGRLDTAYSGAFQVIVDYAHTDKALENLLTSLRELVKGRLILIFGAGGGKDRTKRPRMGSVAATFSDYIVLTSDNPRQENPQKILEDVAGGFPEEFDDYILEVDRQKGIERGISMAQPGDCVVIAGKGHEDYQVFKDKTIHFDDFEVVEQCVEKVDG